MLSRKMPFPFPPPRVGWLNNRIFYVFLNILPLYLPERAPYSRPPPLLPTPAWTKASIRYQALLQKPFECQIAVLNMYLVASLPHSLFRFSSTTARGAMPNSWFTTGSSTHRTTWIGWRWNWVSNCSIASVMGQSWGQSCPLVRNCEFFLKLP